MSESGRIGAEVRGQLGVVDGLIDEHERACVEEAAGLPLGGGAHGEPATPEELVERLVLAARRALLDARHDWIAYARRELRAFGAEHGGGDEPACA